MHSLFNNPLAIRLGVGGVPSWNYAREMVYNEINKLAIYFQKSTEWIPNNHPLIKLLKSDKTPLYTNPDNTLESARERWLKDAEIFGFSTPYRRQTYIPSNIAYPKNIIEFVALDDSIPFGNDIKYKWKTVEAIRVLDHPYEDLNLSIPNGRFIGEPVHGNRAYICINIPVLILQYRLWQEYEAARSGINPDNPQAFLSRYPLFNIINSHMDIVIRNRLITLYGGGDPQPFKRLLTGGVAVNNTSSSVDKSLNEVVKLLNNKVYSFDEINVQVPQLSYTNVAQTLLLPEMSYTRPVRWVYDASRLSWLGFLIKYSNEHKSERNKSTIDFIKRRLLSMNGNKEMLEVLDSNTQAYQELGSLIKL